MKFGMPTLLECPDLPATVRTTAAYGLDFLEVNLSFPRYRSDVLNAGAMNALREAYGIFYTFHADEGMNPLDADDRVAECYTRIAEEDIHLAVAVGAPLINMHLLPGVYVTLPEGRVWMNDRYREEYLEKVRRFIRRCETAIGDAPLKICIENTDICPFTDSQRAALALFLGSPVFALTLDVGHECCMQNRNMDIYRAHPEKLYHMHLHDADGKRAHLPLGEGKADLAAALDLRPPTCLIEVKTLGGLRKSLDYLQTYKYRK